MQEEPNWRLQPLKRIGPTLVGLGLGCLVLFPRLMSANRGLLWLISHAPCGPFEKSMFDDSVGLTHTDVFFGVMLLFIMGSHVFSMRRQTVVLSIIGGFLWVAAAIGHYG